MRALALPNIPISVRTVIDAPSSAAAPPVSADLSFEHAAAVILGRLQHALADLLDAVPGEARKAADVERLFGVDHRLGWQVYRIVKADNPLAAGPHVPARVSMDKLLKAAARRRVPRDIIDRTSQAFDEFERLIETDAGDRATFDAMLSAYIPEEREKYELAGKQAAFKGVSQIKGVAMEADVNAFFVYPSREDAGQLVDRAMLLGEFGLRRVRPGSPIVLGTGDVSRSGVARFSLDPSAPNDPADHFERFLLPQFCSSPIPRFDVQPADGMIYYTVASDEVGLRSAIDLVMADRSPQALRRHREHGGRPFTGLVHTIDTPTKRTTIDVFVHRDLYAGRGPELMIYDTAERGLVFAFDDPKRQHDRLRLHETIRPLPPGLLSARLPHVPRYVEMLELVCSKAALDPGVFRGYRLDIAYPFYGAQYMLGFQLTESPA